MEDKEIKEWAGKKWNNTIRGRIKKLGKQNNFDKNGFVKWFIESFKKTLNAHIVKFQTTKSKIFIG